MLPTKPLTVHPELSSPETPQDVIVRTDFDLINIWAYNLYQAWNKPSISPKELSSLGASTLRFIQCRRKLMKMDYGRPSDTKGRGAIVHPLD